MVTYKTVNYDATSDLRDAINADLEGLAYPFAVTHKVNGQGRLVSVKAPLSGPSLYATIDFDSIGSKMFAIETLLSCKLLDLPDDLKTVLVEAQTAFKSDYDDVQKAMREANRLAYEKKKQEEEDKKLEAKYQASKAKMIKEFENLTKREKIMNATEEFYYSLGWIANNCGAFACSLPDYLLPYFQSQFGTDYEPHAVDSRKRTVNGYAMQWAISMTANIKKKSLDKIPAFLTEHLSKSGNAIADTAFIWDLVSNYGFKFGKTQDIDQIRATIPTDYITAFEEGYAE
jgi:hypothetical protein